MQVQNAVALVTGGASGLGEATVRRLHKLGASVIIADFNTDRGQAVAAELGSNVRFIQTDVADEAQVQAAVDLAKSAFGCIHIAVNCAGIAPAVRVLGKKGIHPLDVYQRTLNVNVVGTFNVIRLAAAAMAEQQPNEEGERGVIVMTASVAAFDGQIGQAAYSASKGAIVGMTLPVARDLAQTGIRVVTIAPGTFDTGMMAAFSDEIKAGLAAAVPFPSRLGRPDEYAHLVQHIAENSMLNGETIRLDGAIRMPPR